MDRIKEEKNIKNKVDLLTFFKLIFGSSITENSVESKQLSKDCFADDVALLEDAEEKGRSTFFDDGDKNKPTKSKSSSILFKADDTKEPIEAIKSKKRTTIQKSKGIEREEREK